MTEVKNMETMIATENQQEATEVMAFLGELEPQEKKDFLVFMQGIRFYLRKYTIKTVKAIVLNTNSQYGSIRRE